MNKYEIARNCDLNVHAFDFVNPWGNRHFTTCSTKHMIEVEEDIGWLPLTLSPQPKIVQQHSRVAILTLTQALSYAHP